MSAVWTFLLARLAEGSTWAAIATGLGAVGTALNSHATIGAAILAGIAAVLTPDKGAKK